MARRRSAAKRDIIPDPKYKSVLISQFTSCIMRGGKKSLAQKVVYGCIDIMSEKTNQEGLAIFKKAVSNVKPVLEVKSRRVGGATYQVPMEVSPARRTALAIRWLISFASSRRENTMADRLAAEMLQASNNEGSAIKKREDTHRMADANKAFAHYRW